MGKALGRWLSATAYMAGRTHEQCGQPCQDYVEARQSGDTAVLALADGAGSASRSDLGAAVVVATCLDILCARFDELLTCDEQTVRQVVLAAVLGRLEETAQSAGVHVSDLASTTLFVATKRGYYIAGHVGDGLIACERNGHPEVLSYPQRGEYANETIFVNTPDANDHILVKRGPLDGITSFALMSDGTAESFYLRHERVLAPGLQKIWSWLDNNPPEEVSGALARNLRNLSREQTADDCSLGVARLVRLSFARLTEMAPAFQLSFLGCASRRGLQNRMAVLQAMEFEDDLSIKALTERTALSGNTVRRHLQGLRDMLIESR